MALFLYLLSPQNVFLTEKKKLELNLLFFETYYVSSIGKVFWHVQPNMNVFTSGVISFDELKSAFWRPSPLLFSLFFKFDLILLLIVLVRILIMKATFIMLMKRYQVVQVFYLIDFILWGSFRFTAKLRVKCRDFTYTPSPYSFITSPYISMPHRSGPFVTVDEPILTTVSLARVHTTHLGSLLVLYILWVWINV